MSALRILECPRCSRLEAYYGKGSGICWRCEDDAVKNATLLKLLSWEIRDAWMALKKKVLP